MLVAFAWKELKAAEKDYERLHAQAEEARDAGRCGMEQPWCSFFANMRLSIVGMFCSRIH